MATALRNSVNPNSASWINGLSRIMRLSDTSAEASLKTVISSDVRNGKLALFVPPDMAELQPENLRYLHALASCNGCKLVEDRRKYHIQPIVEKRDLKPHKMALGISELIQQAGMPGPSPQLSTPHRLAPGNPKFSIPQLIDMVSVTVSKSKRVVMLPPPNMVKTTGNETHPISAYGCKVVTADANLTLSYFDSPGFKAIGYISNSQFVMHVFIGGGSQNSPRIWTNFDAMLKNQFRFQLFRSTRPGQDFGLLYNTFFLDIGTHTANENQPQQRAHARR